MKQLWAPWRSEYISAGKEEGCIFCQAFEKKPDEAMALFQGSLCLVMLNKYPYNSGHLMIAPKRHVSNLEDLTPEEGFDCFRLMRHSTGVLKKLFKPNGFNIGMNLGKAAGAGIEDHMHIHIVPRWGGDTNFMPVISETKIISEHLKETFNKLRPHFEHL